MEKPITTLLKGAEKMKKNVNVKLNEEIVAKLVEVARKNETSVSHEVRQIVKKYFENVVDK